MKNWFLNIGLFFGSIVLFFGGIELTLRVTGLQTTKPDPPKIYQRSRHPEVSYELIAGISRRAYRQTVTTNHLGFRSPEIDPGKPLMTVLGDSIAFGYGLKDSETIPAQLAVLLPAYNVLNAAVPGYDLKVQTAVYREKLAKLNPDVLIIVFHFNDLEGTGVGFLDSDGIIRPQGWKVQELTCDPVQRGILGYLPGRCFLDIHSAFYKAVKKIVNMRYRQEESREAREASRLHPSEDNVTRKELDVYAADLDRLIALLSPDLERLFVIWPDRTLHAQSRPILAEIAQTRGFAVLDLYERFGNEVPTLGWDTVHPNAGAAAQGAKAMNDTLWKNGLIHPL